MGNFDVVGNSHVWQRDRPKGMVRDREIQEQKHAAHTLQAGGLGSSERRDTNPKNVFLSFHGRKFHKNALIILVNTLVTNALILLVEQICVVSFIARE